MFNPLHPFGPGHLAAFLKKSVVAFVRQSYPRGGMKEGSGNSYVLVHFEKELAAQQYFDVLKEDPGRELYVTNDPVAMERMIEMLATNSVFMMLKIKDAEEKARKLLDKKIKAFIEYRLGWRPSRMDEVRFSLDIQFGEVYARLKFRSREIKVTLAEIENM